MTGEIPLSVHLDQQVVEAETRFTRPSAWVLTIATTLPAPNAPLLELHSIYTGHPGLKTRSTHLQLGPEPRQAALLSAEHPDDRHLEDSMVLYRPRQLAYDHAHRLLALLQELGHHAGVEIPEHAFSQLEQPSRPPAS